MKGFPRLQPARKVRVKGELGDLGGGAGFGVGFLEGPAGGLREFNTSPRRLSSSLHNFSQLQNFAMIETYLTRALGMPSLIPG